MGSGHSNIDSVIVANMLYSYTDYGLFINKLFGEVFFFSKEVKHLETMDNNWFAKRCKLTSLYQRYDNDCLTSHLECSTNKSVYESFVR